MSSPGSVAGCTILLEQEVTEWAECLERWQQALLQDPLVLFGIDSAGNDVQSPGARPSNAAPHHNTRCVLDTPHQTIRMKCLVFRAYDACTTVTRAELEARLVTKNDGGPNPRAPLPSLQSPFESLLFLQGRQEGLFLRLYVNITMLSTHEQ